MTDPLAKIAPADARDAEIARLRDQLAERDALLRDWWGQAAKGPSSGITLDQLAHRTSALLSKTEGE